MGLQFIIGPAGSGKTKYIMTLLLNATISNQGNRQRSYSNHCPDQATFQMERAILEDGRLAGFINLHILGFRRLCLGSWTKLAGCAAVYYPGGQKYGHPINIVASQKRSKVYAPMVDYLGSGTR